MLNVFRRILYTISIFLYTILTIIPVMLYLIYGIPRYFIKGNSNLDKTWFVKNKLIPIIWRIEPEETRYNG